ncbi:MAG: DUF4276 family protein [Bacteroidales bacterium]|nr:DUF4276 family protein [Bacteroidales bacterium]
MKRVIIVCEGQTEQSFCNDVLIPYFSQFEIYLETPTIKKTHGGIVNWAALKYQIVKHLLEDKNAFVTTLIDYYGLYTHHEYPGWDEAEKKVNRNERMDILEREMTNDIQENLRHRFMPYIQLHEFEGILFSDISVFDRNFEEEEFLDYKYLESTIRENPNPELINNGTETAPSKRLSKIIDGYYSDNENLKVLYGALLAHDIGLNKIREKCPRFNNWIVQIENM